ncbi:hypothetical protein AMTRI_Chr01g134680 [Amborella trichopoda]
MPESGLTGIPKMGSVATCNRPEWVGREIMQVHIHESVEGGLNKTRQDLRSPKDMGGIQIEKEQDKVKDAAGKGGPVFGAGKY